MLESTFTIKLYHAQFFSPIDDKNIPWKLIKENC